MSVRTVKMLKSNVRSVPLSRVQYTFMQSITPLIHCFVNNFLIKTTPLFNQSFFHMVDVTDMAALDSFLHAPNRTVHLIEIWTVRWPIQWAGEVGCLSAIAQPSHWHGSLGHCPAGSRISHQRLNQWLMVTEICDSSLKTENLVNGIRDSGEIWHRCQK